MMRLLRCDHHLVMIWVCLFEMLAISYGGGRVREFKWDVDYMYGAPDCIEGLVMAINGQFPGPTIRAQVGDTIAVALTNKLSTEGVVIHWHGIRQKGTPWADGTASISQCAINPGETFHYRFTVDKAGTYLYHGHYGMQRSAGLYGSLIVEMRDGQKERFEYDGEFNLLLSDWWHKTALQQEIGLSSIPFRWVGEPQSLLINGRGQYNCSLASGIMNTSLPECKFIGNEQCAPQILNVIPNNIYRLRIASATSLASLNLAILNHKMTVVEADGNYVQPFEVDDIDIYSGESYSVLIKTDQDPTQNYWIAIGVRGRKPNTSQALTFLNYKPTSTSKLPLFPPPITPLWNDFNHSKSFAQKVMGLMGSPKPPMKAQRRIFLLNTQNLINGLIKWAINNVSLALPPTPYLGSLKFGLKNALGDKAPPENFSAEYDISRPPVNRNAKTGNAAYVFEMNQVVDVILQNANVLNGNGSEIHPWHLHGHDFWVLGYGDGKFKGKEDEAMLNFKNPPLKNTVVVFPYGWTALRFRADNPGVWAFHCHIEPHLHMGMGVVFVEGIQNLKTMHVPTEGITCSITKKVISKMNNTHN